MKPFVTDEKTKRTNWRGFAVPNRGIAGKQKAVRKWRSRKGRRRADKATLTAESIVANLLED